MLASRGIAVRIARRASVPTSDDSSSAAVVGEINGGTDWSAALQGVDTVVHLAALAHVDARSVPDALATYRRVNTAGTLRLADAALGAGVRRFLFVSSVKVNGEQSGTRPFAVGSTPAPSDPYGISKLEAEQGLQALAGAGMRIAIVRPPLVYGPGVRANFLRLMHLIERGVPLPLASIDNRRSLVSVENLCALLSLLVTEAAAQEGTFFVSDGEDLSTPELIRRIARSLGRPARLFRFPCSALSWAAAAAGHGETFARLRDSLQVDTSETRARLAWSPPVTVDQALAQTASWYRARRLHPA